MGESKKEKKGIKEKSVKLRLEFDKKAKEAEEYLSQLQYLKADFENYKKRVEREKEELVKFATERIVLEILEVVDNLERAIEAGTSEDGGNENLLEGVEMTYKQLIKILEKEGVECIKAEGGMFDPYLHECVMTENTDTF
jgi:molecular chaperone GrpE